MNQTAATDAASTALEALAQATNRLDRLEGELEHSQRLATLGTLAAGLAHEINNLLTPVISYAQIARADPADTAQVAKALDRIIRGADAVARIVQAVLGFAAAENGQPDVANVADTLRECLDCLARDPAKDGINLVTRIDPTVRVHMPPLSLQQVLLNLIINACNAMRPRGGELRIDAGPGRDGSIIITIADSGPGLPRDMLDHLFEPFASRPSASAGGQSPSALHKQGGTGLGLSVCRRLIEAARGTINATNGPSGAIFTLMLPIATTSRTKAV
jgi:signal transduction histidine kinase